MSTQHLPLITKHLITSPSNVSAWLGEGRQTNQRAELAAIKRAVDLAPINRNVLIMSDSNYSIKCVTEWSRNWEQNGWKTSTGKSVENRDLVEPILERLRERALAGGKTELRWVKGHANDEGNVAADALAVEGAEKGRRIMAAMQAAGAEEMGEEEDEEREGDDRGEEWAWIDGPRS